MQLEWDYWINMKLEPVPDNQGLGTKNNTEVAHHSGSRDEVIPFCVLHHQLYAGLLVNSVVKTSWQLRSRIR
jgi:hypothetical protein